MDWREVYVLLLKSDSFVVMASYIFFILFFVIAAWNIVTSTFVEKSLKLAQPDLETLSLEQTLKDAADAEELMVIFAGESNGKEYITEREFEQVANHPKFRS